MLYTVLEHPFWEDASVDVMVKNVRRCSAGHAHRIHGFNPHRSCNIYLDYVSTVVRKTSVVELSTCVKLLF